MSRDAIRVLNHDGLYPVCAHPRLRQARGGRLLRRRLLRRLQPAPVNAMWLGGDFVLGAAGKLEMERDIARARARQAQMAPATVHCTRCGIGEMRSGSAAASIGLCFGCWASDCAGMPPTLG